MACGDFKDLLRRTASDKVLRDKAFNLAKKTQNNEYQHGILSTVYNLFDNNLAGRNIYGGAVKIKVMSNQH